MDTKQLISSRSRVDDVTGCWNWTGRLDPKGYARIWLSAIQRPRLVHRLSYEAFVGPIPEGLVIDHLCTNRACINPEHLEPVTRGENVRRGGPLIGERMKFCHAGHPRTAENFRVQKNGHRRCLVCHREAQERYELSGKRPQR